jgi:putative membrane protein
MASDVPWKKLHPASVLVNLVPRTWSLLRNLWPLLLAMLYGGRTSEGIANLVTVLLFFGGALGWTALHAFTLRYRVSEGRLEIRSGVLNRQARVIPCDRVQNVERVQNVFHRLSRLVEVRIETASGQEVEGMLSAITVTDADALISALNDARNETPAPAQERAELLVKSTIVDLVWYGASDLRIGLLAFVAAAGLEFLPQLTVLVPSWTDAQVGGLVGIAGAIALVTGTWLAGIGATLLRYYGFELRRTRRALVAEQGLLTRRRSELRLAKIQLVTWFEPILARTFGFGSLAIETAAGREEGSGTQRSEAVVPLVERDRVGSLCAAATPLGGVEPATVELLPPHPAARLQASIRAAARATVLAVGLGWLFWPWGLVLFLIVPLAVALARLDFARQGWLVTDTLVISRRGVITRTTWFLARSKLQSATVFQGPLMRRRGLGVLTVRVAGSRVQLPVLALADALRLQQDLVAPLGATGR